MVNVSPPSGDFSEALDNLKRGHRLTRAGWNGKGMWIAIQWPSASYRSDRREMTLPFIFMSTAQGELVPWLASQADLLATDWTIAEDDAPV